MTVSGKLAGNHPARLTAAAQNGTISEKESNYYRLTACLFGAFCRFLLAGRQPICVKSNANPSKTHCDQGHDSFTGAVFPSGK